MRFLGNGNIRYTFTNEIEHKVEVTANLEINLFIDPKTVQSNGEQKITSKLNGEETEKQYQLFIIQVLAIVIQM